MRNNQKFTGKHLVFYDGECGLCDHIVQFVLANDKEKIFLFAPLQGETAEFELRDLPREYKNVDSLVLIENYRMPEQKYYVLGKGALRICWLLRGFWALLGWISFLPSPLYDWVYRIVARNRKEMFHCDIRSRAQKDLHNNRFLP